MLNSLRSRVVPYMFGLPLGACVIGASADLFDWPEPLPLFIGAARESVRATITAAVTP